MRFRQTALTSLTLLAGCGGPLPPVDSARTLTVNSPTEYKVGVGDTIKLTVYKEPTLSGEYGVDGDGNIAVPVVGPVKAAGRTPAEIAEAARTTLASGFMLDPKVSAEIAEYRPIYVLGEVNKPGRYDFAIGLTALGAVAAAEGYSYRADEKRIFIKGKDETVEKEYRVSANLVVRPGDIIRVRARSF